jgi:cytochrome c biogenesis protein CcmG, thiol:disulfide interchange protein DsbE
VRWLRWAIVPVVVVPLAWVLMLGFGRDPRAVASPLIGRQAPAFELETLGGGTISSDELHGRPVLLNFWASWCIPACVDEHPVLAAAHDRYGDQLAVVGVLYEDRPQDALAFLATYGDAGYPHVVDPEGRLALEFGVTGPPESFFIDAAGVVRAKHYGPLSPRALDEQLAPVLAEAGR